MLTAVALVVLPPPVARAAFSAGAVGGGRAAAASIPRSAAPTAVSVGVDVAVSWAATTMSSGAPVSSYIVKRFDLSDVAQVVLADCTVVATNSCVERTVPTGTWKYTVQAQTGPWNGQASALSAAVTVSPASFALDSTAPITSLPATVTGSVSNFVVGESISFRLDSAVGPALPGSPVTVTTGTSMPVSVTLPDGTTDAPHSIFVVGSTGTFAAATVDIVIPPKLVSMQMRDIDANGKVDQVTVVFDDTLDTYTAGLSPWTLANVPSSGSLSSVSVSGNTATLTITEGPGAANTASGSFTVAMAANSAGVRDVNAHPSSFAATAPSDLAPPAVQNLKMFDTNTNARIDQVTMTFSEPLASYTAASTPWTLSNVPSAGTLASVTVTTPSVTLALTEGTGAVDTGVGSFNIALGQSPGGIRDAAGNLASFSKAPADGATPLRQSLEMFDDNVDGRIDRVLVGFSEPLAAFTAPVSVFSLSAAPSGATINTITLAASQATLALNQGTGAPNTAVGSFKVTLTANTGGVRDAAGNTASFAATAPIDRAAPARLSVNLLDSNGNGKVDRVTVVFSETLQTYTAGVTPWTLTNTPSGGTLASAAQATTTITLTLTEGAGTASTEVGSMTVAMAANATGVRDAAGNTGSFTPTTPLDKARPAAITITDTNGITDGKIEPGDTVVFTFSEPLTPASVPASTTVTLTDPVGTGNDTLTMIGVSNGARTMGANNYVTNDATSASFTNSTVVLSNANRTMTVTVGPACSGTACTGLGQQTANATYSYVAATTLTDVAGNLAATQAKTQSIRLF